MYKHHSGTLVKWQILSDAEEDNSQSPNYEPIVTKTLTSAGP